MDEISIGNFVNLNENVSDMNVLIDQLNKVDKTIQQINGNKINLGGISGLRDLKDAVDKLSSDYTELSKNVAGLNKIQTDSETISKRQIGAYDQLVQKHKEAIASAKNLAAEYGEQSARALEAAKAADVLKQKLDSINAAVKNAPKPQAQQVPFVTNLAQLKAEAEATANTGTVVNDLELAEAALANEATALGGALKEQAVVMSELGAETQNISLKYDEYTGSLSENLKAQYENSASLKENATAQRELLETIESQNNGATARQIVQLEKLRSEAVLLTASQKELTATIRLQAQAFISEGGSVQEMSANLALLQNSFNRLGAAESKTPFGQAIKKEIDVLGPAVKEGEEGIGKFGRNVGNYFNDITAAGGKLVTFMVRDLFRAAAGFVVFQVGFTVLQELGKAFEDLFAPARDFTEAEKALTDIIKDQNDALQKNIDLIATNFKDAIDKAKFELANAQAFGQSQDVILDKQRQLNELQKQAADSNYTAQAAKAMQDFGLKGVDAYGALSFAQNSYLKKYSDLNNAVAASTVQLNQNTAKQIDLLKEIQKSPSVKNIGAAGSLEDQNIKLKKQIELLKEQRDEAKKSYDYVTGSIDAKNKADNDVANTGASQAKFNADEQRKLALNEAQDEISIRQNKNSAILNNDRSSFAQRLAALKDNTQSEIELLDAQKKNLDSQKALGQISPADYQIGIDKINAQEKIATANGLTDAAKLKEQYRLRDLAAEKEISDVKIKQDADANKAIYENEQRSLIDRLAAYKKFLVDQKALADNNYNEKLKESGLSDASISKFNTDQTYDPTTDKSLNPKGVKNTLLELKSYREQYYTDTKGITDTSEKDIYNITASWAKKAIEEAKLANEQNGSDTDNQYAKDVKALNDSFLQKKIGLTKFLSEKARLENKYNQNSLRDQVDTDNKSLDNLTKLDNEFKQQIQESVDELAIGNYDQNKKEIDDALSKNKALVEAEQKTNAEILALRAKLGKDSAKLSDQEVQQYAKAKQQESQLEKELADELLKLIQTVVDAGYEKEINVLELKANAIDENASKEKSAVEQSLASQQDKQKQEATIDAKAAAQKAQIAKQENQIKRKQAIADRTAAVASILENTAVGVMKAYAELGAFAFPVAALIGAVGAVELATTLAAPLPQLFIGKNVDKFTQPSVPGRYDDYEGLAWLNDGPKQEAIIRDGGNVEILQGKNLLKWVGKDDIVLPDVAMLAKRATTSAAQIVLIQSTNDDAPLRGDVRAIGKNIVNAIKNQPRQRPLNANREILKMWISSNKPWKDFFRD